VVIKLPGKPLLIAAAGAAVLGLTGYVWKEEHRPRLLEIYVFSLKSGISVFIRTPEDKRILVDGGGNAEVIRHLSKILPFYTRRIDAVMATAAEGKKVSGLIDVINRYSVERAYIPALTLNSLKLSSSTDPVYKMFFRSLKTKKIPIDELSAGMRIDLDSTSSAFILFPAPADDFAYSTASSPEVLIKVKYGKTSAVFLGNASTKIQRYIASSSRTEIENTNVLIVSQSALPSNMAPSLLKIANPEFLVYSKSVANVRSLSTKENRDSRTALMPENRFNLKSTGDIKIISDGTAVQIKSAP
jgi:competence protein ComEC